MRLIGRSWDPASTLALPAIFGSITGALASGVSTRITQRHQDRRDIPAKRIFYRERLYSDFINENAHPWLMPSNIICKTRVSSVRPMHF